MHKGIMKYICKYIYILCGYHYEGIIYYDIDNITIHKFDTPL